MRFILHGAMLKYTNFSPIIRDMPSWWHLCYLRGVELLMLRDSYVTSPIMLLPDIVIFVLIL